MFLDINKEKSYQPIMLLILDGFGLAPAWGGNAISIASTSNFDELWKNYPHTEICASGSCVGLPGHEVGNSEVGHLNLGAGRQLSLDITKINQAIINKTFFQNPVFLKSIHHAEATNAKIHLMGLLSNGGVHSHIDHLFALLELMKKLNANNIYLHLISDGRDTPQYQTLIFLEKLKEKITELELNNQVKIATIGGRFYAMDRDKHWERIKLYYDCITSGLGKKFKNPETAISFYYRNGLYDETIPPSIIDSNGLISPNDSIIFYNFRSDRAHEISQALINDNFTGFKREKINNLMLVTFVPYFEYNTKIPAYFAFRDKPLVKTLGEVIADNKMPQLHIAETEKYAHVTYFFNGGAKQKFFGEDDILIPSPRVSSYDQRPEMSVYAITENLIKILNNQKYKFIVANFANCDIVGHTGVFDKVVEAVKHVDKCLGEIKKTMEKHKGILIITADHGNAEEMIKPQTGTANPEHTNNPVPFILADFQNKKNNFLFATEPSLKNIAPLILKILNLPQPSEMNATSLVN
ncbi:MAG: 2,3-bisphosphoglycerate-independent phosphoglycerate mutase [Patescibacteria group bacterium]|nr:2,3-bisphosphoglycerate-independent phosphoglycerate mutase [Patescibacteria group bacterium]